MSISRRFGSLNLSPNTAGAPPANPSTRPTSMPVANNRHNASSDPYSGLDSWSAAGGTSLGGRGPRSETQGLQELPAPPPDYQSAVRDSVLYTSDASSVASTSPVSQGQSSQQTHRAASGRSTTTPQRRTSVEDPLSALGRYDIVFLVDDSPSMTDGDRWHHLREALVGVVEKAAKYDRDGVEVAFLNHEDSGLSNLTSTDEVVRIWGTIQPFGSTPTGMRLDDIVRPYIDRCEDAKASRAGGGSRIEMPKPMIVVVITDGRADDPDSLKDCIIEFAGRLDEIRAPPFQLGIQFLQIGADEDATAFLTELDDDIKAEANVRDMVDTIPFTGRFTSAFLLHVLLGSVNRRLDARK